MRHLLEIFTLFALLLLLTTTYAGAETVGQRPYEMVWANRTADDYPPLVDFEQPLKWRVENKDAAAQWEPSREQRIWGQYVGKLVYHATGPNPETRVLADEPITLQKPFDAVSCWIYGNNWGYSPDPATPPVTINALLADKQGQEFQVYLATVNWKEWFLAHRRLTPEQIKRVAGGATFKGFLIQGGTNMEDRTLYFDNLAVFTERFSALTFQPRPQRGISMFPGQGSGTNTGPGVLPFPTRPETILPGPLAARTTARPKQVGNAFVFTLNDGLEKCSYTLVPQSGTLGDIRFSRRGQPTTIRPCVDGGVYLDSDGKSVAPQKVESLGARLQGDAVVSRWRLSVGNVTQDVTYIYRVWNKSLVIDVLALGGHVAEVRYGHAEGLVKPRLVTSPYYTYGNGRPATVVFGNPAQPLFLSGHTDWYLSNASALWAANDVDAQGVTYNGGTRYTPKTDGLRNDCYERLFITLASHYEDVLPNLPNPKSPWMQIAGTRVWRAHAAGDRAADIRYWTEIHRFGMTQTAITDHETMWRDEGESFTFRTRAAPGKGGDKGEYDYARTMQDKLGFVYGPYNNYTDFAPVNQFWSPDLISRAPDNQLQGAWMRCYAPKPARAVEYCALLAPQIQQKFHFSTAYCDVHTAVAPWDRVDYDARVPGAGTFAGVFYPFGEIMLLQKQAWGGPVYSEGGYHCFYAGLTDGNYAQDQSADLPNSPWLVDFDLRKMHPLCCNFGMGNPGMFYHNQELPPDSTPEAKDARIDRFLAATVAFGHPGFLVEGDMPNALRSYYMLQQLHSRYTLSAVQEIRYAAADGKLLDTSAAIGNAAYQRSQIVTRYADGTVTVVNGNPTERMVVDAYGQHLDLPPNGYMGWTEDGKVSVVSSEIHSHRADYAATPSYLYVDGRGQFTRFARAAGNGIGICRILPGGQYEVIPFRGADCGFAIPAAKATAFDKDGKELGTANLRVARGLTYVEPVPGAFSYRLQSGAIVRNVTTRTPANFQLTCARDRVVAGEQVVVQGQRAHIFDVPADAKVGQRLWQQFEGAWLDFTVVPLANTRVTLDGDKLQLMLRSNLLQAADVAINVAGHEQTARLEPERPQTVTINLGVPQQAGPEFLSIALRATISGSTKFINGLSLKSNAKKFGQQLTPEVKVQNGFAPLAALPTKWQAGIQLHGGAAKFGLDDSGGQVTPRAVSCGGVTKLALFMHPPYQNGVGSSFALYAPMTLPATPAAFRAVVGKVDGSDPGDGILYKLVVIDSRKQETVAAQTTVTQHEWVPLQADLSPWAGQTIQLKLIADVGLHDDSSGDWSCWAEMRVEAMQIGLFRVLAQK